MYKKNLAIRTGVAILSATLALSNPISVLASPTFVSDVATSQFSFGYGSTAIAKIVIGDTEYFADSSMFSFDGQYLSLETSFLDMDWQGYISFNNKIYEVASVTASAQSNGVSVDGTLYENYYYEYEFDSYDAGKTYDVQFIITLSEVATTKTVPVSTNSGLWDYYYYGDWKNLNIKVNDTMYALSRDNAVDVTFNNGDTVKILAGDSYELWTGTVSVMGDNVSFSGSASTGWNCDVSYSDNKVSVEKTSDLGWGGVLAGYVSTSLYKYDFTAQADDGTPISGITITDDTAVPYNDIFRSGFVSGQTYTWGTGNSYTYTRNDETDEEAGTVTCTTDENGYTNMLVPIKNQYAIETFGANQFMSGNLYAILQSATPDYCRGMYVYANNGLVDIDTSMELNDGIYNATFDSIGVSTSLDADSSDEVLGDKYILSTATYNSDTVVLKDSFGNEIGTVTMSVDSVDCVTAVDDTYYLVGEAKNGNAIPKVSIEMADGVTDWKVSATYETDADSSYKGTFHIVATKTNKADISVYDVYGASVENGVIDASEATTIARYEESYIEPNSSVSLSNKGVQTIDGVEYTPIVGDDLTVQSKSRSVLSRVDAVQSSTVDVDIEANNSYSVYFYYSTPKEAPKTYTLKVIDVYGTDEVERESKVVESGYSYSYDKNEKEDWKVTGTDSYSGTVTQDTTIYFYYEKEAPKTYTLKVIDVFGTDEIERETKTVESGYSYSYEANEKDDWQVKGTSSYTGVVVEDTTLYFYYEKPAVEEKVNIKVFDHFGDSTEERINETVDKGTSYDYSSLTRDGWIATGTLNYNGVADNDIELHFYYKKPAVVENVNIKVFDHFGDDVEKRVDTDVEKGSEYSYSSLTREDWNVVGTDSYTGVADKDIELHFYYEKPAVTEMVNIKVIDVYPDGTVVRVDEQKEKGTSYSYDAIEKDDYVVTGTSHYDGVLSEDTVLYFYYEEEKAEVVTIKVYDHFGDDVEERVNKEIEKGTSYSYDALNRDDWKVTGETNYSGVADSDVELHFYYEQESIPTPEPEPSQPEEPKTGDVGSPFGVLSLASMLTFLFAWKKRK